VADLKRWAKKNLMGQEYRIAWKSVDAASARAWLLRRGGKSVVFEKKESFEFRFEDRKDGSTMPDASVALEEDGIYFCDYSRGEKSAAIFREIIDEALTHSDSSDSVLVRSL
jgi:hypothetical protein